jgi:NADPH:quinone reductase-like Zn-dependent oxidoreductase
MKTNQRLRVYQKPADFDSLALPSEASDVPLPGADEALIEIRSAGINPSDVKAALGAMPHAVWPRTPGRDWAGVVQAGPDEWIGREVWGSGGDLGIRRDGTHGGWLLVDIGQIRAKPATVSLLEAGAVGVPFITAWEGLCRAGLPKAGDVVLVLGGNGKVGQAATQISTMLGARVFGVERTKQDYAGHASAPVEMLDASAGDIAEALRAASGGHGADIVYNTVGSPYFEAAGRAMALRGRQIFISTIERSVPFDIFAFYRGQHTYVGVDTLALDGHACAKIFDALTPGFESGALRAFPVLPDAVYSLDTARAGYAAVLQGARDRIVLVP